MRCSNGGRAPPVVSGAKLIVEGGRIQVETPTDTGVGNGSGDSAKGTVHTVFKAKGIVFGSVALAHGQAQVLSHNANIAVVAVFKVKGIVFGTITIPQVDPFNIPFVRKSGSGD